MTEPMTRRSGSGDTFKRCERLDDVGEKPAEHVEDELGDFDFGNALFVKNYVVENRGLWVRLSGIWESGDLRDETQYRVLVQPLPGARWCNQTTHDHVEYTRDHDLGYFTRYGGNQKLAVLVPIVQFAQLPDCLLYTSPSPRD